MDQGITFDARARVKLISQERPQLVSASVWICLDYPCSALRLSKGSIWQNFVRLNDESPWQYGQGIIPIKISLEEASHFDIFDRVLDQGIKLDSSLGLLLPTLESPRVAPAFVWTYLHFGKETVVPTYTDRKHRSHV